MIDKVHLFSNGLVMVFNAEGRQMPEYQGKAKDVLARVLDDSRAGTEFFIGDFRNGMVKTTREALRAFAEQFEKAEGRS